MRYAPAWIYVGSALCRHKFRPSVTGIKNRQMQLHLPAYSAKLLVDGNDLIAAGAYAEQANRTADDFLQLLDIVLYIDRKLVKRLALGDVLGEAVELLIDRSAGNSVMRSPLKS